MGFGATTFRYIAWLNCFALSIVFALSCNESIPTEIEEDTFNIENAEDAPIKEVKVFPTELFLSPGEANQVQIDAIYYYGEWTSVNDLATFELLPNDTVELDPNTKNRVIAKKTGEATLLVSFEGFTTEVKINVASKKVLNLLVTPSESTVLLGRTAGEFVPTEFSLGAIAVYNDDTSKDVTELVKWEASAEDQSILSPTDSPGTFRFTKLGKVEFAASFGGKKSTAVVHVGAVDRVIEKITTNPKSIVIPLNTNFSLKLTGHFSDQTEEPLTERAQIKIADNKEVEASEFIDLTINKKDMEADSEINLYTKKLGDEILFITHEGYTEEVNIKVIDPETVDLQIASDTGFAHPAGESVQIKAELVLTDGSLVDVTDLVSWTSKNTKSARFSTKSEFPGLLEFRKEGSAIIVAELNDKKVEQSVQTLGAEVVSLSIVSEEGLGSLALGLERTFTLDVTYTDGKTNNVSTDILFEIENKAGGAKLKSNQCCTVESEQIGDFILKAIYGGESTEVSIQVSEALPVELTIDQALAGPLTINDMSEVNAYLEYTDGTRENKTNDVLWFYDVSSDGYIDAGMVFKHTDDKYYIKGLKSGAFLVIAQLGKYKAFLPIQID